MEDSITNIKKIFVQKRYFLFLFSISLIFFLLNVVINNIRIIGIMFSEGFLNGMIFLGRIIIGFKETILVSTFIFVIIISLLIGLLFTVMIYRVSSIRKINGQIGVFGAIGIFLGLFIPGCVACSVGALGFLGITGSIIGILPLKGLELQILSIALLVFGIIYFSKTMSNSCSVNYS